MSARSSLALALAVALPGCAFTDLDRLALTNLADRKLVPGQPVAREVATTLLVPLGLVTLALDNLVVWPVAQLPSAVADTRSFWDAEAGGYFTEMGLLPGRLALLPIVLAGDWLGRSFFGLAPRSDAAWGYPEWGRLWVRDHDGRLLGPPSEFDRVTKGRLPPEVEAAADDDAGVAGEGGRP